MRPPFFHIAATGVILWGLGQAALAECPTTGVPLIVETDGEVIATFNGKSAGTVFSNDLYLEAPNGGGSTFLFNNFASTVGSSLSLGHFTAGTELVFRLHVTTDTGKTIDYFTGLQSRNPDGLPHARVTATSSTVALVEFEDLLKLPECKKGKGFNDLSFTFSNVKGATPPDSYVSYKAKAVAGTPKFQPIQVTLSDQIGTPGTFTLGKPKQLASPASVQGSAVNSPELSLERYKIIKKPKQIRKKWRISNELGNITVKTLRAHSLLTPASLSKNTSVDPLALSDQGIVDPLTCYSVKLTKQSAKFKRVRKSVESVLDGTTRNVRVKKPIHLCTPADKDGKPAKHPQIHLMCYAVKPVRHQAKYQKTRVAAQNEIEPTTGYLKTLKERQLCLPSTVETP